MSDRTRVREAEALISADGGFMCHDEQKLLDAAEAADVEEAACVAAVVRDGHCPCDGRAERYLFSLYHLYELVEAGR